MIKNRIHLIYALSVAAAWAQGLTIDSPRDYQVFQRQTRDQGKVLVSGHAAEPGDSVEVRLSGGQTGKWTSVKLDASRAFGAELGAAAGGFYSLDARLLRGGKVVAQAQVAHVGVGEVFVIAGQSNATNNGEVKQETRSGMVVSFSGDTWQIANDPQPGVQDSSKKGSFIPAFGDAMYARYHVPIGVACVGHGATSVRQWLPKGERFAAPPTMGKFVTQVGPYEWEAGGELFDGMMKRVRQLGTHGFQALLWHQGESDANQKPEHNITGEQYRQMLEHVIRASWAAAGWEFPWFVAQASYHAPDDPGCAPIREAQRSLWTDGVALEGPDTDSLTGDNRQNHGTGVHFSDQGLKAHGELWAVKVSAYLDRKEEGRK